MKNLYKYIAPFLSDTFGFQEIVDVTDGMGILDDCSPYHAMVNQSDRTAGYNGSRMQVTSIRMDDVIHGTKEKLLNTFRSQCPNYSPAFVLVGNAPVALMIGTDLEDVTSVITQESGIPAAAVELGGHNYYDKGISETLLSMAKLLVQPTEKRIAGGINLLGGNALDWNQKNVRDIRTWAEECGFTVISQWGGPEQTGNLKQAACAQVNLVTAASGLAVAKWMKEEFGTPYVAAAPFGNNWSGQVEQAVKTGIQPEHLKVESAEKVLILGEQLTANAIRATLEQEYGMGGIDVGTFFLFEKALAAPGDKRIKGEDGLQKMIEDGGYSLIFGDPNLNVFSQQDHRWIALPHAAVDHEMAGDNYPDLVGGSLNQWLDSVL